MAGPTELNQLQAGPQWPVLQNSDAGRALLMAPTQQKQPEWLREEGRRKEALVGLCKRRWVGRQPGHAANMPREDPVG